VDRPWGLREIEVLDADGNELVFGSDSSVASEAAAG
jgi:hypothetical protein